MSSVYLDNAASTRPAPEVMDVMGQAAGHAFANPSSAHAAGAAAARLLEEARHELATALGGQPSELVFTSGGTEANALGVLGAAGRSRGRHLVVSAIEHPAVLRNAERLAQDEGFTLTLVAPDASGITAATNVAAAVGPDTALVAVMLVNNELGTMQPVVEMARALTAQAAQGGHRRPHFHVDAVQGFGQVPFRVSTLGADSVAVSAHKIHGPKGVGALWVRAGARLRPLWAGGGQERELRAGTEDLPGIVGFARAATLAHRAQLAGGSARTAALRDELERAIQELTPASRPTVTVAAESRAPHICSLAFPGLPAEPLLHALGARGVTAAAGSACASRLRGPSHVLKAIGGIDDDMAVLRFSLSRETTAAEIALAARAVAAAVSEISATSPLRRRPGGGGPLSRRGAPG